MMNSLIWSFQKAYYRVYQTLMGVLLKCTPFPKQTVISGSGSIGKIPSILKERKINNILLVCSKSVRKHGLLDKLLLQLDADGILYTIFEDIKPNPTTTNVEEGHKLYIENACQAIVAIGGGSPLDCAKLIGVKVTSPKLPYETMHHITGIKRPIPLMIAVPTTAGTGSESTVAAVITDEHRRSKYSALSLFLMPKYAILDENLTLGLPKDFSAYTGMDALTHAIEAYVGNFNTNYTRSEALKAIKLIFENLELVYSNPINLEARKNMLIASNYAANAFTRAYVGYVHSISHALSALYDVGHGKTNAIILPYVLKFYGKSIESKLAHIAIYTGLGEKSEAPSLLAQKVITKIEALNTTMGIPDKISEIRTEDIDLIVDKALTEANPSYPVPKIMSTNECMSLVRKLIP